MERYYFLKVSRHRKEEKTEGIIAFHLKALYSQKEFSQKFNRERLGFKYFDDIDVVVNTKSSGLYCFSVNTGVNGCCGEVATNTKELYARLKDYKKISEQDYFRLRSFALQLMFRHTQLFNPPSHGTNGFAYSRPWSYGFHKVKISVHNELYNRKGDTAEQLEWLAKHGYERYDVVDQEMIEIFISKTDTGYKRHDDNSFIIRGNGRNGQHNSFEEARKRTFWDDSFDVVQEHQYLRIRKLLMKMIFDVTELDISSLLKEQTYSVTVIIE